MDDKELSTWVHKNVRGITDETYAVPEYASDRNDCAVAEAEIAKMGRAVGEAYAEAIREIYTDSPDCPNPYKEAAWAGWATARQRCDAMYAIRDQIAKAA